MKKFFPLFVLAALVLTACDSTITPSQPISPRTEEPEAVTNDFTLVKACIGTSGEEANSLHTRQGYSEEETQMYYRKYTKTVNGITKEAHTSLVRVSRIPERNILHGSAKMGNTQRRQMNGRCNIYGKAYPIKRSFNITTAIRPRK